MSWRVTTANSHLRQRKQDRGRPGQGVWSARPFPWEDRVPGPGRQPRRRRGQDGLPPKRPPLAGGRRLVCLLPLPQQRSSKPDSGTRGKPPRASRRESAVRPAPSLTRTRDRNEGGRPPAPSRRPSRGRRIKPSRRTGALEKNVASAFGS